MVKINYEEAREAVGHNWDIAVGAYTLFTTGRLETKDLTYTVDLTENEDEDDEYDYYLPCVAAIISAVRAWEGTNSVTVETDALWHLVEEFHVAMAMSDLAKMGIAFGEDGNFRKLSIVQEVGEWPYYKFEEVEP